MRKREVIKVQIRAVGNLRPGGVYRGSAWRFGNRWRQGRGDFGNVQWQMTTQDGLHGLGGERMGIWREESLINPRQGLQARAEGGLERGAAELETGWVGDTSGSSDRVLMKDLCVEGGRRGGKEKHHR